MIRIFCLIPLLFFASLLAESRFAFNEDGKITAQYTYEGQILKARAFYEYDSEQRLSQLISDDGCTKDPLNMEGVTQRFIKQIQHHPDSLEVLYKFRPGPLAPDVLIFHTIDTYSSDRKVIQREETDREGTYTHMTFDKKGKPTAALKCFKHGAQQHLLFEYDHTDRLISVSKETRQGVVELIYDERGFPIIKRRPARKSPYANQSWYPAVSESVALYQNFFSSVQRWLEKLPLPAGDQETINNFDQTLELLAKGTLGEWTYNASGFYSHPGRSGVYGNGEIHDKVRITLINGILNDPVDHMQNLDLFCELHGGVNIHYIFRPYEGYTRDILRCACAKVGWVSQPARDLANKWKKLIAEMGGTEGGGLIIHYAHSIGGTDTTRARSLMTKEELKMIRVYTFGSASLIPNHSFQSVENYTSLRDGVSQLADPFSYLWGLLDAKCKVTYVGSPYGTPLVDHLVNNPAYKTILERLGAEFTALYR